MRSNLYIWIHFNEKHAWRPWKSSSTTLTFIGAEHKNGAEELLVSAGQVEALQIQASPSNAINSFQYMIKK